MDPPLPTFPPWYVVADFGIDERRDGPEGAAECAEAVTAVNAVRAAAAALGTTPGALAQALASGMLERIFIARMNASTLGYLSRAIRDERERLPLVAEFDTLPPDDMKDDAK